jgi:hypothetical protein
MVGKVAKDDGRPKPSTSSSPRTVLSSPARNGAGAESTMPPKDTQSTGVTDQEALLFHSEGKPG